MEEPGPTSVNDYFGRPMTDADLARIGRAAAMSMSGNVLSVAAIDSLAGRMRDGDVTGDSLDDIVMQNQQEMERRRSMQPPYGRAATAPSADDIRRTSMMDFDPAVTRAGDDYHFHSAGFGAAANGAVMSTPFSASLQDGLGPDAPQRHHGAGPLALDTRFAGAVASYPSITHASPFQSAIHSAPPLELDSAHSFPSTGLSAQLAHSMSAAAAAFSPTGIESASSRTEAPLLKHMGSSTLRTAMPDARFAPAQTAFAELMHGSRDPGGRAGPARNKLSVFDESNDEGRGMDAMRQVQQPPQDDPGDVTQDLDSPDPFLLDQHSPGRPTPQRPGVEPRMASDEDVMRGVRHTGAEPVFAEPRPGEQRSDRTGGLLDRGSMFPGVYSSSGFDMLKILMRVATRAGPEINIGAVDMSCAFVVCDVSQHDLPIVYCSEVFERLTGYNRHEILGRNCRFLQAPDGKVKSGVKRQYVDDKVVLRLKKKITDRREVQTSLINYRKGGQPFMNLLTMIPISWDTPEIRFYVGFQVDLVETPQSVTNKNPDGTYSINYQRGYLPRYVWNTPENRGHTESGQTIPRDDVSTVLSTIGTGESELSKRIWDKVLLENTDDVVHVLSLKGLFLYLSPSSRKVLGYDSSELVGTALSSVCHPSDIVPVTRELKDTSPGASVNVVFRIRRKLTGYTWFESHGSLHTEQGKGRKCIILVGRERPVYALSRHDLDAAGGIGDSELWTKMSTSGMFLFVSSHSKTLLDRPPEELVGTSIQALMRRESKLEFGRQLEVARTGKQARVKHEMQNRRGQVLQAQTTLYPGDASEGRKPTFLVAQTRLIKMSRSIGGIPDGGAGKNPSPTAASTTPTMSTGTGTGTGTGPSNSSPPSGTPRTGANNMPVPTETVTTQPGCGGLPIGNQDDALAADGNVFDELKTTRSTSWQFELRQMEKRNRLLAEELHTLLSARKKRKRRRGPGQFQRDCANCHTRTTPEWRRGPSGNRDLCNSCGLRWAKQNGRVSPRTSSQQSDKQSASPAHSSPPMGDGLLTNHAAAMAPPAVGSMAPPELPPPSAAHRDGNARTPRRDTVGHRPMAKLEGGEVGMA